MARSRNTADTQTASGGPVSPNIAGKNLVINGDFGIWQRGTSFTSTNGTGFFGADRFNIYSGTTGRTFSRQNTSPTGNSYFIRIQRDSGNTNTTALSIFYTLETAQSKPLAGKTLTLSFYARAGANFSAASSTMFSPAIYGTGTDQNQVAGFTGSASINNQANVLTTSWQRFTMTGTVNAAATQVGFQLAYTPVGTAGAADYMDIADVQWEVGSVATPFQTATGTIQGELAACQRYYFRTQTGTDSPYIAVTVAGSATTTYANTIMKQTMRTTPTSVDFSTIKWQAINNSGNISAASISSATPENVLLVCTTTGATAGAMNYLMGQTNASYVGFSAEL